MIIYPASSDPPGPGQDALWQELISWVSSLINVFGEPEKLAGRGLMRRMALRLRNWLWSIEGVLRRLVLAAALGLDPKTLPAAPRRTPGAGSSVPAPAEDPPARPATPRTGFRFLHVLKRQGPKVAPRIVTFERLHTLKVRKERRTPIVRRPPPERFHSRFGFPADPLLALGPPPPRKAGLSASSRHRDPCGVSRLIAHTLGQEERDSPEQRERDLLGLAPDLPARLRLSSGPAGLSSSMRPPPRSSDPDWLGTDEEWRRILPAPDLGARLTALLRVIANPQPHVLRLARYFLRRSHIRRKVTRLPPPVLIKPKGDPTPIPFGLEDLDAAHRLVMACDTS